MRLDDSILKADLFSPVCSGCIHLKVDILGGGVSCTAFKEIPDAIWTGRDDHTKPFPGDKGILFEPIEEIKDGRS